MNVRSLNVVRPGNDSRQSQRAVRVKPVQTSPEYQELLKD